MYQKITKSMFHDAFRNYGRLENFSYEGREALFDFLEECHEDEEVGLELDIISLCCDYSQDKIENVLKNYSLSSLEELHENTVVVWSNDEEVLYLNY